MQLLPTSNFWGLQNHENVFTNLIRFWHVCRSKIFCKTISVAAVFASSHCSCSIIQQFTQHNLSHNCQVLLLGGIIFIYHHIRREYRVEYELVVSLSEHFLLNHLLGKNSEFPFLTLFNSWRLNGVSPLQQDNPILIENFYTRVSWDLSPKYKMIKTNCVILTAIVWYVRI